LEQTAASPVMTRKSTRGRRSGERSRLLSSAGCSCRWPLITW
jgi:hypothetical protein